MKIAAFSAGNGVRKVFNAQEILLEILLPVPLQRRCTQTHCVLFCLERWAKDPSRTSFVYFWRLLY